LGHNKTSCKGKRAAERAIPKGGNKVFKFWFNKFKKFWFNTGLNSGLVYEILV
jgi:hypothetical protein